MSGIDLNIIRHGDRVRFYGDGDKTISRRVDAIQPGRVGVWYQGAPLFLTTEEIRSWERQ